MKTVTVHHVILSIVNHDELSAHDIAQVLESSHYYPNNCIHPTVIRQDVVTIHNYTDQHPINSTITHGDYFRQLFPQTQIPQLTHAEITFIKELIQQVTFHPQFDSDFTYPEQAELLQSLDQKLNR